MSKDVKVFLSNPIHPEAQQRLAEATTLIVGSEEMPRSEMLSLLSDVDIIFNKLDPVRVDAEMIDAAPRLRLIARHGSGYSNVDLDYATKRGIPVTTTPGANSVTMAEYTLGLLFAAARNLIPACAACHQGDVDRLAYMGMELNGKTFGIIGVGAIGREVVKRVHALGMKVVAYHPRPSAKNLVDLPLELVGLEELLTRSDVVSIHSPLTADTANLLDAERIALLKPTACVLNLGRGGIVVEKDMIVALQEKRLACYATDVLEDEPVKKDNPLLAESRAIVFPHIAAVTREAQLAVAMTAVDDILRVAEGQKPLHVINPQVYTQ